jgi:hypothetical protein
VLDKDSSWFAGFFDADSTITISMKNNYPQLSIRAVNKPSARCTMFQRSIRGKHLF